MNLVQAQKRHAHLDCEFTSHWAGQMVYSGYRDRIVLVGVGTDSAFNILTLKNISPDTNKCAPTPRVVQDVCPNDLTVGVACSFRNLEQIDASIEPNGAHTTGSIRGQGKVLSVSRA